MMKTTESRRRANDKWIKGKTDSLLLRASPREGAEIREQAKKEGLSITRYLVQCHGEHMEQSRRTGGDTPNENQETHETP